MSVKPDHQFRHPKRRRTGTQTQGRYNPSHKTYTRSVFLPFLPNLFSPTPVIRTRLTLLTATETTHYLRMRLYPLSLSKPVLLRPGPSSDAYRSTVTYGQVLVVTRGGRGSFSGLRAPPAIPSFLPFPPPSRPSPPGSTPFEPRRRVPACPAFRAQPDPLRGTGPGSCFLRLDPRTASPLSPRGPTTRSTFLSTVLRPSSRAPSSVGSPSPSLSPPTLPTSRPLSSAPPGSPPLSSPSHPFPPLLLS